MNRFCNFLFWIFILLNYPGYHCAYSQNDHVHKEPHSNIPIDSLELINQQYDQEWNSWRESLFELDIHENMLIGEVGAGNGEFAYLLSAQVGQKGHVYANEVDQSKIHKIKNLISEKNIDNMTVISGDEDDALFPVSNLDMAIMIEVYHHIANPNIYFKNLCKYLIESGKLVIIDPDVNQPGGTLDGCYSDPESTKSLLLNLGYRNIGIKYKRINDLEFYILSADSHAIE